MKLGKATRDIFAATTPAVAKPAAKVSEQPSEQPYVKATVVLRTDQVVFLDRVCSDIRARSGAAIARAELIRALVDALAEANLDVTSARTESELRGLFSRKMKA